MIIRNLQLTINNDKASLNEPITLFLGDKNICLHIALKQVKYLFNAKSLCELEAIEQCHACEVYVKKPNEEIFLIPHTEVVDNLVHVYVDSTWTDELLELGSHEMQIILYSAEDEGIVGRITLPSFKITVMQPLLFSTTEEDVSELLTEDDVELLAENGNGIKISQLPTTTQGTGYLPIVQNGTTHKYNLDTSKYLTEHQDLSAYATETYVKNEIANAQTNINATSVDGFSFWCGTQSEYDALTTKDSSTIYMIKE